MQASETALILIGYQNDYFAKDGILHAVIEESSKITGILGHTVDFIENLVDTDVTIISTPIVFTENYSELVDEPVGILKIIKDVGAFKANTHGGETIEELKNFGDRILEVPGKRGLNAFSNTNLDEVLRAKGIKNVIIAGTVTSICIDSTGRAAFENGYNVTIATDCTSGRTNTEQEFYCENIFPLYAATASHQDLLKEIQP